MRFFRQLVAGLAIVSATSAGAQSSPSPASTPTPAVSAETTAAEAEPSPAATVSVEPPSLIPPNILPAPAALPQVPAGADLQMLNALFKQSSLGKVADEYRLHLQMVGLETRIRNSEDLHALKMSADKARTDLERRHWLRAYYQLYFKKLRTLALTPELQDYLRAHQAAREASLLQPRVRHETDEAEATALRSAGGGVSATTALRKPVQARANDALRHP
jgi:hypothetical protein